MQNIDIDLDSIVRHTTRHDTAHLLCTGDRMNYFAHFTLCFTWMNYIEEDFVGVSNLRIIGSTYK